MERWRKLLDGVLASRRNTRPQDLRRLMELLDFDSNHRGPGGHSVHFRHRTYPNITASMATNANPVKVGYVNECLTAIEILFEHIELTKKEEMP